MVRSFVFQDISVRVLSRDYTSTSFGERHIIRTVEKFKETDTLHHESRKNITVNSCIHTSPLNNTVGIFSLK